jgi:hypothetical protein
VGDVAKLLEQLNASHQPRCLEITEELTAGQFDAYRRPCRRELERVAAGRVAAAAPLLFAPPPADALGRALVSGTAVVAAQQGGWEERVTARAAVIYPGAVEDPSQLLLLTRNVDPTTLGGLLLRCGRPAEAVQGFRKPSDYIGTKFYQVLAEQAQGHSAEADQLLEGAVRWLDAPSPAQSGRTNAEQLDWLSRVEVEALRREIEGKLQAKKP